MKKNVLFIIALFVATSMSAQFYIGAKVGYGFGAQKTDIGTTLTDNSEANIWGSLGQGFTPGLKVGYFFNDNLGIELGINYLIGAKITGLDRKTTGVTILAEAKTTQFRLLPALVYKTDMGIYGRFGLSLPVAGNTTITTEANGLGGPNTTEHSVEVIKGKFTIGFAGAMGYAFELNENLHLFGELEYIGQNIRAKTSEITEWTRNGVDQVANADVYDIQTNYVDELDASSNTGASPDKTKPEDVLGSVNGYSSFRINIGITMSF
jgi:opacity protein-like surface antigen